MPEPALTDRELRIVRGMIDEYTYHQRRAKWWRGEWKRWQVTAGIVGATTAWFATIVTLVYLVLNGGHS